MSLNDPIDVHRFTLAKEDLDVGITDDLSAMTVPRFFRSSPAPDRLSMH